MMESLIIMRFPSLAECFLLTQLVKNIAALDGKHLACFQSENLKTSVFKFILRDMDGTLLEISLIVVTQLAI